MENPFRCSPTCPHRSIASAEASKAHPAFALVHRPLCYGSLRFNTLNDFVELCFYNYASHDHFPERSMQRFEIEDQVQFADILKQAIERLDEDLDKIEESQGRFSGRGYYNEIQGSIMTVGDERRRIIMWSSGGR